MDMWLNMRMADDALMGMYTRAVDMDLAGMEEEDVFGVMQHVLPDSPQRLLERGFAIIHSVKSAPEPELTEEDIRDFFRAQRAADEARGVAGFPSMAGGRAGT
jgi:hypothetical protein